VNHIDSSYVAALNQSFYVAATGFEILSICGHEENAVFSAGLDHQGGLIDGGRERLFAQHVPPCKGRCDRQMGVFARGVAMYTASTSGLLRQAA
jgi:hypothetical protein